MDCVGKYLVLFALFFSECDGFNKREGKLILDIEKHFQTSWILLLTSKKFGSEITTGNVWNFLKKRSMSSIANWQLKQMYDLEIHFKYTTHARALAVLFLEDFSGIVLKQMNKVLSLSQPKNYVWVLLTTQEKYVKLIKVRWDCEFIYPEWDNTTDRYILSEIYKTPGQTKWIKRHVGTWDMVHRLIYTNVQLEQRRSDLMGEIIRVRMFEDQFVLTRKWESFADRLNATTVYKYYETEVDVCAVPVILRLALYKAFVPPMFTYRYDLFYRKHDREIHLDTYVQPFDSGVWFRILIWLMVSIIFTCIVYVFQDYCVQNKTSFSNRLILDVIFEYAVMITTQDRRNAPIFISAKVLRMADFLIHLFLFGAYSAVFMSFITADKTKIPFNNLSDVVHDGSYTVYTLDNGVKWSLLEHPNHEIRNFFKENAVSISQDTGHGMFKYLCDGKSLVLTRYGKFIEFGGDKINCTVSAHSIYVGKWQGTWAFSHTNSSYRQIFQYLVINYISSGSVQPYIQKNDLNYSVKGESPALHRGIELDEVLGLFAILGAGIIISVVIFLLEILCKEIQCHKKEEQEAPPFPFVL